MGLTITIIALAIILAGVVLTAQSKKPRKRK